MEKILVTGGAGYIGTTLVPMLLDKGYDVTAYDSLMYGGQVILPFFSRENFHFVKGDIRDNKALLKVLNEADAIIHLAAIVGYPACKKDPILAKQVNEDSSKFIADNVTSDQFVVYASTGSNYGALKDGICREETPLNPISVYGKTKASAEKYFLEKKDCNAIVYRYATAFGLSPRLRLDLLINDFVYQVMKNNYLLIYEKHFRRTFIHVKDIARSMLFALENKDRMVNQVYNVGDNSLNCSKEEIANILKSYRDYYLHFVEIGKDEDQRDYEVDYNKINSLGFRTTIDINQGIKELIKAMSVIKVSHPYSNV
jgi:nucleoside-diphosphate-sugar epimerase